jgi:hypothetical protein
MKECNVVDKKNLNMVSFSRIILSLVFVFYMSHLLAQTNEPLAEEALSKDAIIQTNKIDSTTHNNKKSKPKIAFSLGYEAKVYSSQTTNKGKSQAIQNHIIKTDYLMKFDKIGYFLVGLDYGVFNAIEELNYPQTNDWYNDIQISATLGGKYLEVYFKYGVNSLLFPDISTGLVFYAPAIKSTVLSMGYQYSMEKKSTYQVSDTFHSHLFFPTIFQYLPFKDALLRGTCYIETDFSVVSLAGMLNFSIRPIAPWRLSIYAALGNQKDQYVFPKNIVLTEYYYFSLAISSDFNLGKYMTLIPTVEFYKNLSSYHYVRMGLNIKFSF